MKYTLCTVLALTAAAGLAQAQNYIDIGVEDPSSGWAGALFPGTAYNVGSDGESAFRPFGITADCSDALSFDNVGFLWTMDANTVGWTQDGTRQTWYIDAASVGENEPAVPEPIGYFSSPVQWNPAFLGTYRILGGPNEPGEWDEIILWNDANGAHLSFNSDAPTPGAAAVLGLGGLMGARRRRR
jgi:MYXO-CTERM domain-containing protein